MTKDELEKKSFLTNYLEYTKCQESPTDFHFWIACTLIGAATQRKVYYDQHFFKLYPNLYTGVVAESAICKKSTAMDLGMSLFAEAMADEPIGDKIVQGKITPKGLIKKICPGKKDEVGGMVFIQADEMGVFFGQDMINLGIIDLITSLYMCKDRHEYITAEAGSFLVRNSFINILTGGVPSYLRKSVGSVFEEGLIGRMSFVRREEPHMSIADIARIVDLDRLNLLREVLIKQLRGISKKEGSFSMTDEAFGVYEKWYKSIRGDSVERSITSGFIGRKGDHARKMAMILSLAASPLSDDPLVIDTKTIYAGIQTAKDMERDLKDIFEQVPAKDIFEGQKMLEQFIRKSGRVSRTLISRKFHGKILPEHFDVIIASLERPGIIQMASDGRTTFYYYVPEEYRDLSLEERLKKIKGE